MLSASCHCGAVRVEIPRRPRTLTNCNCSICRRYGTLWCYFKASEVRVLAEPGVMRGYRWGPKTIEFMRCDTCGCIVAWRPTEVGQRDRMGVNARNFEPEALGDVRIRLLDGASWPVGG